MKNKILLQLHSVLQNILCVLGKTSARAFAIIILVAGFNFFIANNALASTLINQTGTGFSFTSTTGGSYRGIRSANSPSTNLTTHANSSWGSVTLTSGSHYYIQVKTSNISGITCANLGAILYSDGSGASDYTGGTVDGDYCQWDLTASVNNHLSEVSFFANGTGDNFTLLGNDTGTYGTFDVLGASFMQLGTPAFFMSDDPFPPVPPEDTSTRFLSFDPFEPYSVLGSVTASDSTVVVDSTADLFLGEPVSAIGIPVGSVVSSITNSTTFELSHSATITNSSTPIKFTDAKDNLTVDYVVHVYVNSNDWVEGTEFQLFDGTSGVPICYQEILVTDLDQDFEIDCTETYNSSLKGVMQITWEIISPTFLSTYLGFLSPLFAGSDFLEGSILLKKTFPYVLFEQNAFDLYTNRINDNDSTGTFGGSLSNSVSNSFSNQPSGCYIATFDFGSCLSYWVLPTASGLSQSWDKFHDLILSRAPLGYITRFISIVTNTTAIKPPPLEYTFSSADESSVAGTGLEGETLSYQIYDHFDVLESIESDQGDHKNIWDIIMPWINTAVALAVFLFIFFDLIGIGFSAADSGIEKSLASNSGSHGVRFSKKEMEHINNPTIQNYVGIDKN